MSTPPLRTVLRSLAAAAAVTIATMYVYAAVQQTYRSGANDPQVQLAGDTAAALRAGVQPPVAIPPGTVDLTSSLASFVIVYDAANRPLAGSGSLEGSVPVPPAGVLALARQHGWHSITWMPRRRVRIAAVLRGVDDGSGRVVLAGRSLREVEERESRLLVMTALAWAGLLVTGIAATIL